MSWLARGGRVGLARRVDFFNPLEEIEFRRNRLPHWQQVGRTYFVTFRLADSFPTERLREWGLERDAWLKNHPEPWSEEVAADYHRRFSQRIDQWLDEGIGSCVLADARCGEVVQQALRFFEGERCRLFAAVVMPNHVHALVQMLAGWRLDQVLHSWRRHSAREINRLTGAAGALWQRDYFDRLVRDAEHFGKCVRYIRKNPERARVAAGGFRLWESEVAREVG